MFFIGMIVGAFVVALFGSLIVAGTIQDLTLDNARLDTAYRLAEEDKHRALGEIERLRQAAGEEA